MSAFLPFCRHFYHCESGIIHKQRWIKWLQEAISNCSLKRTVQHILNSKHSGKIRGPLVDQIGAARGMKWHQVGVDEKGFFAMVAVSYCN